jgi:hypothetical protein
MHIHRILPAAALLVLAAHPTGAQARDSAALVTVLGSDTVAVERWVRRGTTWEAVAAVRSPRASLRRYTLETDASGAMRRWEERWLDPANPAAAPTRTETLEAGEGGWTRRLAEGDSVRTARIEGAPDALPFVDLVHWPFELAVARVPASGQAAQPLLAGGRAVPFTLARTGAGEVTITHPLRGPSVARVDAAGRLQRLDAGQTTRKVVVTRVPWVDVEGPARRWAEADRAGRGMGELSGRATETFEVGGARITLDYGVPVRRGREIWGAVVPWGRVWRTGANRATHFTTTRDLVMGGLTVPAGAYTLFSVPAEDGGVLIVNRQTNQNGTAHDPAQDLGRVPMRREPRAEPAERLAITVDPSATGGTLRIVWDRSEFVVPFTVR